MQYIAFDSHKRYTQARVERSDGTEVREVRIDHERGALRRFLEGCDAKSPVALETIGNWYWIVDEIEAAGMLPRLVNARKAKLMIGNYNKTDKLDAKGLNLLQRTGTLPAVWIPPADLRDRRDLPRTRMMLVKIRTKLKNRIHATLAKYALSVSEVSDMYGVKGRELLSGRLQQLPEHTRFVTQELLQELDHLQQRIQAIERRIAEAFQPNADVRRLMTLPGVGFTLAVVIWLEIGDIKRFMTAERLASYAGTTPRVISSGGKTRYGQLRPDVNRYLKWALIEAANITSQHAEAWSGRHVADLYTRLRPKRGHPKAVGAVARHLAEASFWMLSKEENYRDPGKNTHSHSSTEA